MSRKSACFSWLPRINRWRAAAPIAAFIPMTRLTEPPQTATEQLLVSTAVDHAASAIKPAIPAGSTVFVDTQYLDTAPPDSILYEKYAGVLIP